MRALIGAVTIVLLSYSAVQADTIKGVVKKVDGNTIIVTKYAKGKKNKNSAGEDVTLTAVSDVKVFKGRFDKQIKTITAGAAITDGLKASVFTSTPAPMVQITTDSDGKVTQILVISKKAKKKPNSTSDE